MDYDCTFGVKHYEEGDAYLIVIPIYYFGNGIASWFNTKVGEYYNSILTESNKRIKRIYIYHTENGDDKYKISDIFEFMLKHVMDFDEILTFSQYFTCNKIATVGTQIYDFNYILTFKDSCTCNCHDCYFI